MNKLFTKIAAFSVGLAMAIGVGVAVGSNNKEATPVHAADPTVTYTATSVSALSTSGTPVTGSSATLSSTGAWNSGGVQMTNGKNMSLTITGYAGYTITGLSVSVRSNSSKGTGSLTFTIGGTTKASIAESAFNSANWYGSWSTSFVTVTPTLTSTTVGTGQSMVLTIACKSGSSNYNSLYFSSVTLTYKSAKTELTGITLSGTEVGGTSPNYNLSSIAKSDTTTNHTVSVGLTPNNATDQKVKVEHYDGDSVVNISASTITCTSGSGSFNITSKGSSTGTERLKIYGNTETSVVRYLSVTVYDDSVTNWTVSFDSNGGATIADMTVEDGETFEFPSPGTKTHYSFDGWSSDGGNTLYDAGDESPAVGDDIEYTAYWTQDAQTTVIYKSGDGTGSDISSTEYAGSYSLASFPGTWTAPSGKAFSKWSDGSSQYSAGANYTLVGNTTVTFTAVYKAVDEYTLFSGALVEGDYVICSGTKAMKNETTSSPRIDVADVTVTNNKIVDPDASIIWHIAQDGDYWTIYNAAVEKYAAFTSTNGRGTLIDSVTDYARFTTSGSYEFINVEKSDKYLRYNATYGFASYSTSTGVSLTLYKAPSNELSSIALSGDYKTSFPSGDTFSFGGTVTASYTKDDPANVTSKTTFHLDSADGTNMSGVTMTHAAHDGHTIYAKYTEGGITKTATYEISVANAPVSSVAIETHAAEIGFEEDYSISGITPTVLPADAVKTTEWVVSANTVNNDYTWTGTKLTSGNTEGTVTLRCRSTVDNSKYDELVVTVTGDPTAEFTPASVSGYVGKSDDIAFTYGNMSDTSLISITSSNSSIAEVDEFVADAGEGLVTVNFVAAGSATLSISYDGGSALDTVGVTVSTDSVTALTWSAPTIKVYSGATTTVSDASSWNVHYTMASGDEGDLSYGEYTLKLGGSSITLPHTWDASEDGKVLSIEYGGFVSPTTSTVNVTQTLQAVNASDTSAWDYTFTEKVWSAEGSGTLDDKAWTMSGTGNGYWGYDATKGQQFGSGSNPYSALTLSSSAFSGTIASVTVYTSGAKDINATVQVSVGGTTYGDAQTITATNTDYTFDLGGKSGTISIDYVNSSSKAIYIKEIVVNTVSGSHNIANVAGHEAAQKAVVAFAKAMNDAFDETKKCTEGVAAAWSTASSAYASNITNNASLSAQEKAYANNLIKYATAQYTDDTDEDFSYCLERAMKTYETCIQKHGQTGFIDVRPVEKAAVPTNPLAKALGDSVATTTAIVVVSLVSVASVGGYFFIRRRKVQ